VHSIFGRPPCVTAKCDSEIGCRAAPASEGNQHAGRTYFDLGLCGHVDEGPSA
jgi:hypothetical protein